MKPSEPEKKFLCDRMAGSLCKYLRFMGYDCTSANDLSPGDPREDTNILTIAKEDNRIILTQDAELAQRGGETAIRLKSSGLSDQIVQLIDEELIIPEIRLTRCSCCNTLLMEGTTGADRRNNAHTPDNTPLVHCPVCHRQYWEGTHTQNMRKKLESIILKSKNQV
ncbi:MAG: DUF5615 family PIN-like protein [Methanomicrobiales archaeon]|nr:DUF5615 family PIN-like protein [Methanomicrobiales archaeon]